MARAVGKSNNENYTFRGTIKEDDASNFIKAMKKKILNNEYQGHWEAIKRNKIPKYTKTIQSIWSFKRKRFLDGNLNKDKARLYKHGWMQQWG